MTTMKDVLDRAIDAVCRDRGTTHGADTGESFEHIAALWSAYLGVKIQASDVPQMMVLLKISRAKKGDPSFRDHYVDQAGYAAVSAEVVAKTVVPF